MAYSKKKKYSDDEIDYKREQARKLSEASIVPKPDMRETIINNRGSEIPNPYFDPRSYDEINTISKFFAIKEYNEWKIRNGKKPYVRDLEEWKKLNEESG